MLNLRDRRLDPTLARAATLYATSTSTIPDTVCTMSAPSTPTKRVLTDSTYSALHAPRLPYENALGDDLMARLQNVGARIRKNVNEGYATQRIFPSMTPTPYPSPTKPGASASPSLSTANALTHPQIFRSANDTLADVFSSPYSSPERERVSPNAGALRTPSSSPRKRGRGSTSTDAPESDEDEDEDGDEDFSGPTKLVMVDRDATMGVELPASPTSSRPIRPLRKTAAVPARQAA